jgi:6-methylsalicylic acid synthase
MGFPWEVRELRRGDCELLARVAAQRDESPPTTWAGLLDAAASVASTVIDSPPRLRMPARIDRVRVHGTPPAEALLHVRRRADNTITDVSIADPSGVVSASITGMAFEELEHPVGPRTAQLLHHVAWHPAPRWDGDRPTRVAVVGGDAGTLASVVRELATAEVQYRICADSSEIPGNWGRGAVVLVLPRPNDAPEMSVGLVLQTLKRLQASGAKARVWVLTHRVHEGVNLGHAPLWGLARVAAAEHPQLWGGVLDLFDGRLPVEALSSLHGHGVVVARDGGAYTARLAHASTGVGAPMRCSPGGTYLITGGTGVLGLRVAQRLADLGARRLVLVSRSGMPGRASWNGGNHKEAVVRIVSALEERGVSVDVPAVDVGAPGAAEALRSALRDLPPVRGVIHAAGVETGALLVNTTPEDIAATMHPKVNGALTLHEVFPPGQLDWLVLFSSCGYLAGFPGQGAYACANAFLDAIARRRRSLGDRTTSVAWTAWRGLGMGSTSGFLAAQLEALGMGTIGVDEAMLALDLAMRTEQPNVVVLPVLAAAASVPMFADVAPATATPGRVEPPQGPVSRGCEDIADWVAQQVHAVVASELGLPEGDLDPRLPLVEAGVDSIMTVALRRQLENRVGLRLPPTLLWEYPTAAAVTARIVELLALLDTADAKEKDELEVS